MLFCVICIIAFEKQIEAGPTRQGSFFAKDIAIKLW